MSLNELLKTKREEILCLAKKRGASNVRVLGPVAADEVRSDSEIEFLIKMEAGRTLFDVGGLLSDLEDLLGCKVNLETELEPGEHEHQQTSEVAVPL